MSLQKTLDELKSYQDNILNYIKNENDDSDKDLLKLRKLYNEQNLCRNKYDLELILRLLINISNNHHRTANFFGKIEQILQIFKDDIFRIPKNSVFLRVTSKFCFL